MATFPLGKIVATQNAANTLSASDMQDALRRHSSGDWGDLDPEDVQQNETGAREGYRLLSAYKAEDGTKFWIITEGDRSITTILLPEDY